jgi:RNA polymerase sigma factor (sigma-70 family)
VSVSDLTSIEVRIQNSLSSHQQWILSTRRQPTVSQTVALLGEEAEHGLMDVVDKRPDQEAQLLAQQRRAQLKRYVISLPAGDRLILQLRFEQELSLDEIAGLSGLGDAQRVHRRLATILGKLRSRMT